MRRYTLIPAVALVTVLAACSSPAPEPTTTPPAASPTPSSESTSTPPPVAAEVVLPDCETLLPLETARAASTLDVQFLGEQEDSMLVDGMSGPASAAAMETAEQRLGCMWGIPQSDSGFGMYVAEITPETRDALVAELVADGYADISTEGVPQYGLEWEEEFSGGGALHQFVGDVWICWRKVVPLEQPDLAAVHVEAVKAANPGF